MFLKDVMFSKMADLEGTLLKLYPFLSGLMRYLTPGDILRLSRVNRDFKVLCDRWLSNRMDLGMMLYHYVKDVNMFRVMQKKTGAVISGSFALQFFSCLRWKDSDLDVFLPESQVTRFARYLVTKEKYRKVKVTPPFYARMFMVSVMDSV